MSFKNNVLQKVNGAPEELYLLNNKKVCALIHQALWIKDIQGLHTWKQTYVNCSTN